MKLLLVEDDRIVRITVRDALVDAGYAVTDRAVGAAALDALRSEPFDIVLTDVRLPGADDPRGPPRIGARDPRTPPFGDGEASLDTLSPGAGAGTPRRRAGRRPERAADGLATCRGGTPA